MNRRLRFTRVALDDLEAIYDYLYVRNPMAADRYIEGIKDRCAFYANSPFIGQAEPEIARRIGEDAVRVRSFPYRDHRCYDLVTDEEMRVLGLIDTRSDIDAHIEDRFPN